VSVAVAERPATVQPATSHGGPARRAIFRWSLRLFRREWRQQVLVLALVLFAVAATTVGIGLVYNADQHDDAMFGTANSFMMFPGPGAANVAAARRAFGTVEEIDHQRIPIPGSINSLDVRAQDPNGRFGHPTLRLVSGRYPTRAGEIALTADAAASFGVHVGGRLVANRETRDVVGLVENPLNLSDEFALVAPGQADPPAQVTILFDATSAQVDNFRPAGGATGIGTRSS